jgi:ribonuclease P protein component
MAMSPTGSRAIRAPQRGPDRSTGEGAACKVRSGPPSVLVRGCIAATGIVGGWVVTANFRRPVTGPRPPGRGAIATGRRRALALPERAPTPSWGLGARNADEVVAVAPTRRGVDAPSPGGSREAHLPAQRPQAGQEPRVPQADVHPCRSRHPAQPTPQGSGQAVGLIGPVGDRRSFEALRVRGVRVRRGPLGATHVAHGEGIRVAYAIGTRTGPAVVRNRLRRRFRAILADLAVDQPGLLPPGALLIAAGPAAVPCTTKELKSNVIDLLEALRRRREGLHR